MYILARATTKDFWWWKGKASSVLLYFWLQHFCVLRWRKAHPCELQPLTFDETVGHPIANILLSLPFFCNNRLYLQPRDPAKPAHADRDGIGGFCWKLARIGERLSPFIGGGCLLMAIHVLFFKWLSTGRVQKGCVWRPSKSRTMDLTLKEFGEIRVEKLKFSLNNSRHFNVRDLGDLPVIGQLDMRPCWRTIDVYLNRSIRYFNRKESDDEVHRTPLSPVCDCSVCFIFFRVWGNASTLSQMNEETMHYQVRIFLGNDKWYKAECKRLA